MATILLLSLSLSLLLLFKQDNSLLIVSNPANYSYFKTDDHDTFHIPLLVSNNNTYHFDDKYITSLQIVDKEEVNIIDIYQFEKINTNQYYEYKGQMMHVLYLSLKPSIDGDYVHFNLKDAYVKLKYQNQKEQLIYIGSLSYLVTDSTTDLSLGNLYATHGLVNNSDTVTGLYLELKNKTNQNIYINNFNLLAPNTNFDHYFLSELNKKPEITDSVEEVLEIDSYSHIKDVSDYEKQILIKPGESKSLYVPVTYQKEIAYIYKFAVCVNYTLNGETKGFYIDDFPYINTSPFKMELEGLYREYTLHDWG